MARCNGSQRRSADEFNHRGHRAHRGAFASSFFLHPSYFLQMTLGRTSSGAIKIKTDGTAGLRAVECACCETGPCNFPSVCLEGYPNNGWGGDENGCSTSFLTIPGCGSSAPPGLTNTFWIPFICGGAKWALLLAGSGGACLGNVATNFYCKNDGIDSPIGTYYGYNYGGSGYLTFTVTEC